MRFFLFWFLVWGFILFRLEVFSFYFGASVFATFLHFGDRDGLITVNNPVLLETPEEELKKIFVETDFRADYKLLNKAVSERGFNIPPLVNAYMNLSPTMRVFGTAVNDEFGNVEETSILIAVDEILEDKRKRHIESYVDPQSLTDIPKLFFEETR